uniref:Uncharacterized protein n=1 Tax=Plectus sambesii TaxID=2011161 RepID=A0A914XKM4_9BILA
MSSLSQSQLNTYLAEYDDVPAEARTLQNFGTVEFVPTSGGFQVTCQCTGSGDTCYLEFAKNNNQFLKKNTISETKPNKGAGTYNLITSAEITCDANGNNILNGQEIGKYACYSALHTNCESRLSKLSRGKVEEYNSVYNGVPGQEGVIRSLGGTEEVTRNDGFIETCKCSGAGDFCVFEFAGSFDDFLLKNTLSSAVENNGDNTYDLIRSPKITCDENGNNILQGQIVKKYTCYAVTFTN